MAFYFGKDAMAIIKSQVVSSSATTTDPAPLPGLSKIFQCTSSGASSATVNVEVSNDKLAWIQLGTTISLPANGSSGFVEVTGNWQYGRFNVTNAGGGQVICTLSGQISTGSGAFI